MVLALPASVGTSSNRRRSCMKMVLGSYGVPTDSLSTHNVKLVE